MAEVEIHTAPHHAGDRLAQRVGVAVGIIGIILAIVTIGSHRAHTQAVINRTEENDLWSFYQARKIRQQVLEVGAGLAETLVPDTTRTQSLVEHFRSQSAHEGEKTPELEKQAREKAIETAREEGRAVRLDLGEGFLELGLVLSSLYFLSRRNFFPVLGVSAALIGTALGIAGFAF
ncbi:MAG: DUF4337 domain-containing protein [Sinobacteraceae bacterium]|nr:DUF4337 domain-containing protein [Nevskiaceae bacterium]MBV8853189.1 DUF4337 domain-containing protein [Nevskiaceae bacterium]MBV9914593.1 DUF4337 domain-containing protein [Nevskiaceae bacterium]